MKNYLLLTVILLLIILFITAKQCLHYRQVSIGKQLTKDSSRHSFTVFQSRDGQTVAEQKTTITGGSVKSATDPVFKLTKKEEKKVKRVHQYAAVEQQTRLRAFIPYDTIYRHDTIYLYQGPPGSVDEPRRFTGMSKYYSISGTVGTKGVLIDSLMMNNRLDLRFVEKRQGLLKPPLLTVQAINTNPYIHIEGMQTISRKLKPNAWNRWIKPAIAAGAAAYITYKISKP